MARIPVAGPWVTDLEVRYVAEAAAEGNYAKANYYVQRFETKFAEYLGVRHALAVPHCTSAIHLALAGFGIGAGDEVIVPEITWIGTSAPISYVNATPVFADIDPRSWNISPESVERCITKRTKAIIPVHLYGQVADMPALRELAAKHDLFIIEDVAQAIGSRLDGRLCGSFGDVGTFSFHGAKTLTTGGQGGMFTTDNSDLFKRVCILADHGRTGNTKFFYNTEVAFKYHMSSLQAAFGLAQLERIDELVQRKREIFGWYAERLADIPGLTMNEQRPEAFDTFWMVTTVLDPAYGFTTRTLMAAFDEHEIDTRPFFHPLSGLPAYAASEQAIAAKQRNSVAYDIASRTINLPSALKLTEPEVDRVCSVYKRILGRS